MVNQSWDEVFRRGGGVASGNVIQQGGEGQSFELTVWTYHVSTEKYRMYMYSLDARAGTH